MTLPISDDPGRRVRELRIARRLSQEQLAAQAGVVAKTIWSFEAGRRIPRIKTRQAIAEVLGVPVEELEVAS